MAVMIESLIGILLFTVLIVSLTLKNPLTSVGDYPPAIREKCMELGLIEKREQRFTREDILRKGIALLAFVFIFAVILKQFNGADTFWKGFRDSYLIWLIIDWYDALILDCIWFCHSKKSGYQAQRIWKDIRTTVFISGSPVLVCFLACPPVLQWERLQQSSDQPSNDIKQNMIRIRQEISFEVSCFFFTLKRKEVPHGPSGHQI